MYHLLGVRHYSRKAFNFKSKCELETKLIRVAILKVLVNWISR